MAFETEFCARAREQTFCRRSMRIMAGGAFARLCRGMFDLRVLEKIIMTFKAELGAGARQQALGGRGMRIMAPGAFA